MIVMTACRVDERKFAGFFFWTWFERDLNVIRGHELWLWKKRNLPDRVSVTALLTSWLSDLVNDTDCVLLIP